MTLRAHSGETKRSTDMSNTWITPNIKHWPEHIKRHTHIHTDQTKHKTRWPGNHRGIWEGFNLFPNAVA